MSVWGYKYSLQCVYVLYSRDVSVMCILVLMPGSMRTVWILRELTQLCQISRGDKPANPSSRNGDPTSTRMHQKKGKHVGIKNKKGVSYLQYQVKRAEVSVPMPQEPAADSLLNQPS